MESYKSKKRRKGGYIAGWNKHVAEAHREARLHFQMWELAGKPNRGSLTIVLSVFAVLLVIGYTEAGGDCPLPSKVYGCSPKCKETYECTGGKICCRNSCNALSCAEPVAGGQGTGSNKYSSSGSGVYCNNQKCSPQEVCKMDPATKRMKCVRS